jgi:hypothetical protein
MAAPREGTARYKLAQTDRFGLISGFNWQWVPIGTNSSTTGGHSTAPFSTD